MLVSGNPIRYFFNLFSVLFGTKSLVGYVPQNLTRNAVYPEIKEGVLNPSDALKRSDLSEDEVHDLNLRYAKDYKVANDIQIIWRGVRLLGRK